MKIQVIELKEQISKIHKELQRLFPKGEEIRKYYKYQNSDFDSVSESFIINLNNLIGDTYGVISDLEEIIEMELDDE